MPLGRLTRCPVAVLAVLAGLTGCTEAASSPAPSPSRTASTAAAATFTTLGVHMNEPRHLPPDVRKYGVHAEPTGRIIFQLLGSSTCLDTEGPAAMPVASPHHVAFKIHPRGCSDDQRRLTVIVQIHGLAIDRTKDFLLELRQPPPFGRTRVTLPASA